MSEHCDFNPLWPLPDQVNDPLKRARQVARVLFGLLDEENAEVMREAAIRHGEWWLVADREGQ